MKKTKICKGINKAHGFESCGKEVEASRRKYGLCPVCFWDWMQNTEGGKTHYKKQFIPKVEKNVKKELKKKEKEKRESLKSIRRLINDARVPFQEYIRLRDANKKCISCPSIDSQIWDAGHYLKAEIYTGLIFDERNVNKQCRKCNTFLSGNEANYRLGLIERFGKEFVEGLENEADKMRVYKFTREEIKEIHKKYRLKVNEWKQLHK